MKHTTKTIRPFKKQNEGRFLEMLTCYDFQMAQMLNETPVDIVLVGDSLGNVILGHQTTIEVTLEEMIIFSKAVKKGAPDKFVMADLPFACCATFEKGLDSACALFQQGHLEAIKIEGAHSTELDIIKRLTQIGIPVMGHIGLTPQSVHEQGGYYIHGKDEVGAQRLVEEALNLEKHGIFALVLECVSPTVTGKITKMLKIPTIGIGSGDEVDGHVLVINDLLGNGPGPVPKFCTPILNLYDQKKKAINEYLHRNAK